MRILLSMAPFNFFILLLSWCRGSDEDDDVTSIGQTLLGRTEDDNHDNDDFGETKLGDTHAAGYFRTFKSFSLSASLAEL